MPWCDGVRHLSPRIWQTGASASSSRSTTALTRRPGRDLSDGLRWTASQGVEAAEVRWRWEYDPVADEVRVSRPRCAASSVLKRSSDLLPVRVRGFFLIPAAFSVPPQRQPTAAQVPRSQGLGATPR